MRSGEDLHKALKLSISNVPFDKGRSSYLPMFYLTTAIGAIPGPVVGLQIRRTDKIGTEAAYHSVEEYMQWTERWFKVGDTRNHICASASTTRVP